MLIHLFYGLYLVRKWLIFLVNVNIHGSLSSVLFVIKIVNLWIWYKPNAFEYTNLLSCFTGKDNRVFGSHLDTFHFLRLKQKMNLLSFLIKKLNNKTVGYNVHNVY